MDFALTPDQREIQALARDVAQAEIEPNAAAWDREHRFPTELYDKLGELGLMGVCVPAELGGAGADFISYILVLEELSRGDAGVGVTVAVHTSACTLPILAFGTDEQRERFVPPLARGETIGARIFAVADAIDAITNHRPYREARSWRQSRQEILEQKGKQFDPQVVDAFCDREFVLHEIRREFLAAA